MFFHLFRYVSLKKLLNATLLGVGYLFRSIRVHRWTSPLFLSVEPAAVCNLRCPQCAVGRGEVKRKSFMDVGLLKKIVDECAGRLLHLQLYFQGEPLLNRDLPEMVAYAHKKGIYTSFSTNAQLFDAEVARRLVEAGIDHVIISVDGASQETYEKYRVGGELKRAVEAIGLLREARMACHARMKIEVQFIVFKHNEHEVESMKGLVREWGADCLCIKTAQVYDYENISDLMPKEKRYRRYVLKNGQWQTKKKLRNRCWRCWCGAVVNSDGDVLPCCFDKAGVYAFGNVREEALKDVWNGARAQAFRKHVFSDRKSIPICNNCTE